MATITERDLAATIDHAILKPELTRADVDAELDIAAEWRVFSVCVRPSDIAHAVARLDGTGVAVGTVIGFPHGTTSTAAKVAEVRQALGDGATEFDMVVNIGALRSGFDDVVTADIAAVVAAASGHVTKVILETSLLDDEQIARGSRLTEAGGADFVKTSTGFHPAGGASEPSLFGLAGSLVIGFLDLQASRAPVQRHVELVLAGVDPGNNRGSNRGGSRDSLAHLPRPFLAMRTLGSVNHPGPMKSRP